MKKSSLISFLPFVLYSTADAFPLFAAPVSISGGGQFTSDDGIDYTDNITSPLLLSKKNTTGLRIRSSTSTFSTTRLSTNKETIRAHQQQQEKQIKWEILHVSFHTHGDCSSDSEVDLSNVTLFSSFLGHLGINDATTAPAAAAWNIPTAIDQDQAWNLGYEHLDKEILIKCVRIDLDIATPTTNLKNNFEDTEFTLDILIDVKRTSVSTNLLRHEPQHAQEEEEWKEAVTVRGLARGANLLNLMPTCQGHYTLWRRDGACQSMNNMNCNNYHGRDCSENEVSTTMKSIVHEVFLVLIVLVLALWLLNYINRARMNSESAGINISSGITLHSTISSSSASSLSTLDDVDDNPPAERGRNDLILAIFSNIIQKVS